MILKDNKNLKFEEEASYVTDHKRYLVISKKSKYVIGKVKYYASSGKYCFFPEHSTVFSKDDLSTIMFNIALLSKEM